MGKLIKNYLFNGAYQLFAIIIPLFTAPFLTRVLGSGALGIDSYVLSIVSMTQVFGALGMNTYSNREVAYKRNDKEKLNNTFYELFFIRLILGIIVTIGYLFIVQFSEFRLYFTIQSVTLISYFLDISWFFVGIEEMKIVVIRNTIVKAFTTACIFIFIRTPEDLSKYIIIYAIGNAISSLCVYLKIKKYISKPDFSKIHLKKHIKPVLLLFLPQAATQLYIQFDKTMIGMFTEDIANVSIYEKAEQIVKTPLTFVTAMTTVIMPRVASEYKKNNLEGIKSLLNNALEAIMLMMIPIMLGLIGVARTFIPFYLGNEYANSGIIVQILSPIVIAIGISNITGAQYLVASNQTKILTASYLTGAIFNIIANYFFIKNFQAVGAAIATVIAETLVACIQYYFLRKQLGSLKIISKVWKKVISGLIMLAGVLLAAQHMENTWMLILTQLAIGVVVYILGLLILRDETFILYANKGKNVIKDKIKGKKSS